MGWSERGAETLLTLEDVRRAEHRVERQRERDLTAREIIRAVLDKIIPERTGQEYLRFLGYSDWEIKIRYIRAGIWPTPREMAELFKARKVSRADAESYIADLGWSREEIEELFKEIAAG